MNLIKAGMWLSLIAVMSLIGWAAKWTQSAIAWWFPLLLVPAWIWIARQIDKSDARKARDQQLSHSPPPEPPGQ